MWKIIKTIALRNMCKSTALIEKMAAIENAAEPKITLRMAKSWQM
jgi:hypothetical protein